MDPFVRKLVLRLLDERMPLSRNRHFQTFETVEGKTALKLSKRLRALARDIEACVASGGRPVIVRTGDEGELRMEISFVHLKSRRMTVLDQGEFELLQTLPGMRAAVSPS